jgi:hypothetical protein
MNPVSGPNLGQMTAQSSAPEMTDHSDSIGFGTMSRKPAIRPSGSSSRRIPSRPVPLRRCRLESDVSGVAQSGQKMEWRAGLERGSQPLRITVGSALPTAVPMTTKTSTSDGAIEFANAGFQKSIRLCKCAKQSTLPTFAQPPRRPRNIPKPNQKQTFTQNL